jgi:hypothetical protein
MAAWLVVRPEELALWFDALATSDQASIGAALITVVGFLVAFQTAYDNARAERLMNKEIEVADTIVAHYEDLLSQARTLNVFADFVCTVHDDSRQIQIPQTSMCKCCTNWLPMLPPNKSG